MILIQLYCIEKWKQCCWR